jgi:hypothetical protein
VSHGRVRLPNRTGIDGTESWAPRIAIGLLLLAASGTAHGADARWGLLANPGWDQQPVKGVYFFPGEGACQASDHDAQPSQRPVQNANIPNDPIWPCHLVDPRWFFNSKFFTYVPSDPRDLHWHDSADHRTWAVNQIAATHANVIVMSRWGAGVNNGAPMQGTLEANDQLFAAVAATKNILIMPAIDTFTAHGIRDFRTDFPGTPANPAPQLLAEVADLVSRYLSNPAWRERWAQMYDTNGVPRYAINWIHAASTYNNNGCEFARGLDWIADRIENIYRHRIGFTIDPFNAYLGDAAPKFNCDFGYCPSPYNSCLGQSRSLLGIQGFNSEIVRAGDLALYPPHPPDPWAGRWSTPPGDANDRLSELIRWKRAWIKAWIETGVPVLFDVSPGYDGRYVFAREGGVIYGDNADYSTDEWRNAQSALKGLGMKGTVYNAWNGYTEGLVAAPGVWIRPQHVRSNDGRAVDGLKTWLTDYFSVDPRVCDHVHYVNFGQVKHHVYGAICAKWQEMNAGLGVLGQPVSSELDGCNGARRNLFQFGSIVHSPNGTWETHGLIGEKYRAMGYECSGLGPPTSDEHLACGRTRNLFQGGTIIYSSGATAAYETHGSIAGKYGALGHDCGVLGAPVSDEVSGCGTNRRSYFESGAIVFSSAHGAYATYGLIGSLYRGMDYDCSWLGPPTSDEKACDRRCPGGRTNDFQNGHIDWCPGWNVAKAVAGPSGC